MLYINCKINKTIVRFLVDTGSVLTIIPKSLACDLIPSGLKLTAANGSNIRSYGSTTVNLSICKLRRDFPWRCVVADVKLPIIGADFLAHYNILVDCKQSRLIDGNTKVYTQGQKCNEKFEQFPIQAVDTRIPSFISQLLKEFPTIVQPFSGHLEVQHNTQHHIETTGPPLAAKCRPLYGEKLHAAKNEFVKLTELGVVQPSKSPWSSPIHMVPKGDSWRIVGDYRRLNNVTKKDRYPMNNIDALRCILHGNTVFSKLDLIRGYNQIPMHKESIEKTAVVTPFGLYEYRRMPFGLCNASQTFQRCMNELFGHLPFIFVYIDDMLIFSSSEEEHRTHMKQIFHILSQNNLRIGLEKCEFFKPQVTFLGYDINSTGLKPRASKCEALEMIDLPETVKGLHSFLGAISFYRHHIRNFADTAAPLYDRIKNAKSPSERLDWTDEEIKAFVLLKAEFGTIIEQSYIDPSSDCFIIRSDASSKAIGAALYQVVGDEQRTIQFYSRKLSETEKNYSTFDRELLAAHDAVQYFLPYIDGQNITLFTDHRPLVAAFVKKGECKSERQSRHLNFLSEHLFALDYVKGSENVTADFLSRPNARSINNVNNIHIEQFDLAILAEAQQNNKELNAFIQGKTNFKTVQHLNTEIICETSNGKFRPFVTEQHRFTVFQQLHSIGHNGVKNSCQLISERFYWPEMSKDIKKWVQECLICQQCKITRHTKTEFGEFQHPSQRFSRVHMDIVGPLPASSISPTAPASYKYLLTCVDAYTRWVEAMPLCSITAEEVAQAFLHTWVSRFGVPLELVTDRGRQFESELFQKLSKKLGFIKLRTSSYNPRCNGLIERQHKILKAILRCRQEQWIDALPLALFAMRMLPHSATKLSPFTLVTGTEVLVPNMFLNHKVLSEDAHTFVQKLAQTMELISFSPAEHHNKPQQYLPKELSNCKKVWVRIDRTRRPLEAPYSGPYKVLERNKNYFKICFTSGKTENVSIHRLKPVIENRMTGAKLDSRKIQLSIRANSLPQHPEMEDQLLQSEAETNVIPEDNSQPQNEDLPNHIKFANQQPFKTRYGRRVTFTKTDTVHFITPVGKGKPVISRSHTVKK